MIGRVIQAITTFPAKMRETREFEHRAAEQNPHLMKALEINKRQGQVLAVRARWVALALIAVFIPFIYPYWSVIYYEFLLVLLAILGWAQLRAAHVGLSRTELILIFFDLLILTIAALVPNPFAEHVLPTAVQYQHQGFYYFFIILAGATLAYSWRTLFAIGMWTTILWVIGMVLIYFFGTNVPLITETLSAAFSGEPLILEFMDLNLINVGSRVQEILIFLIVAGILALSGWRNNQWMMRQAASERERENLARYFPPSIVDDLADQDHPFDNIRQQPVAVLFADIVGFTRIAEQEEPEKVVALLRQYHQLLETAVFENNGTLDKFLGDGIMATFGSPTTGPRDAANAMKCAADIVEKIQNWNDERVKNGESIINISVGVHYGEVILGDIGSERRLEFATLGDTVNVAARLEQLTRSMDTKVIVSDALIEANRNCKAKNDNDNELMEHFAQAGVQMIRGRDSEIKIWKMQA